MASSIVLAGVSLAGSADAQGTLMEGQTMSALHLQASALDPSSPVYTGPVASVVGPGVEVTGFGYLGFMDIDYSDREILITARVSQAPGILAILGLNASAAIPDFYVVLVAANWFGYTPSMLQVTRDSISLHFSPADAHAGDQILVRVNPIPEPSAVFCVPGDAGVGDCPCAPPHFVPEPQNTPGHGCANSIHPEGARLDAYGDAIVMGNSLRLVVTNVPNVLTIFLEGDASAPSSEPFGDGVRCIGGNIKRFGDQIAIDGVAIYPGAGQTPISVVNSIPHGATRYYQAIYRNANASWCSPATFNVTNGYSIVWH